jgi:hypothetical protein
MAKGAKLQPILALLLLLIFSPLGIFLLHILIYRSSVWLKLSVSGQATALISILLGNVPVLLLAWYFTLSQWKEDPLALVSGLVYTVIVHNVLGLLYFDFFNISETSLHMHILLEIAWAGKLSQTTLKERYSAESMIRTRLERMMDLSQVQLKEGRYYLVDRSVLRLTKLFTLWRTILGLPTEPEIPNASPRNKAVHEA